MNECKCKQCRSIKYAEAIIKAEEAGQRLSLSKILKRYDSLHYIAQRMIKAAFNWSFTGGN